MADRAAKGALAGMAGAGVMALMMRRLAPRMLPESMRPDEFVPKQIVERLQERVGRPQALDEKQAMAAGMAAHLGYGGTMGAAYAALDERLQRVPQPLRGMMYGVALWGIGFEGWGPALGLIERTTSKPPSKWPAPIMGHMVYGLVTTFAYRFLKDRRVFGVPEEETRLRWEEIPAEERRPAAAPR